MAKPIIVALSFILIGCATVPLADNQYELTENMPSGIVMAIAMGAVQGLCARNNPYDPSCYQDYSSGDQVINEWEGLEKRALKVCEGYTVVDRISTSNSLANKRTLIIQCPFE